MLENEFSGKRVKIEGAELIRALSSHERYVTGRGGARLLFKGAELDGAILANRRLDEADLTGASLIGANLHGSNLTKASLYCADLRNSTLRNAKLMGADLRGASFQGADLTYAVLDYADLRSATMMYVGEKVVEVVDRSRGDGAFGGVDFSNSSLRNASFGHAKLDNANFSNSLLSGASFRGAQIKDSTFRGAVLTGVNISELKLPPEAFTDCVLDVTPKAVVIANALKTEIELHHRWTVSDGTEGTPAILDGRDLRPLHDYFAGRSLVALSARNCIAIGVDFSGCQLQGAKFDGADLRGANFAGADLSGASFKSAKLAQAKFDKARLGSLHLRGGDIIQPNLLGAEACPDQFSTANLEESLATLGLPCGEAVEIGISAV